MSSRGAGSSGADPEIGPDPMATTAPMVSKTVFMEADPLTNGNDRRR
jgi:hypothetical protein